MSDGKHARDLQLNSQEYQQWVANEKAEFDRKDYNTATMLENITSALSYSHEAFNAKVAGLLGQTPWDYIVQQVNARPGAKVLSLGSGPCGVEIALAKMIAAPFRLTCLDLNGSLLAEGCAKAREAGIQIEALEQDANLLALNQTYDVILAHAALHHFLAFEHIFPHVHDHLSPNGVFIAHEYVPRNGMLLWPRTKQVVDRLWATLPPRYRRACRGGEPLEVFPDIDYSQGVFECIRSEEIVPLLETYFRVDTKISGQSFTRRFVDGGFGDNYDLTREEDVVILNMLLAFDDMLTASGYLIPENVFMVMRRKDAPRTAS